ncbi:ShlB/FhaC/HecB family hemolysin secretion/activation protein [Buttiauxella warmboldiae]|uniref:ShlB/FhaC/HecB family hemolysin secretion/activation protein n=1 Tax=Buttiauxella warmboldiae TaxID=82993 RepID=A0A3N5D3K8_9ENTR|nr:ShlB/FhaC/HecB family hemolysin secretion/activation protein [Buttiauxella warmboldiae]RPH22325.1 ShlB/FhaC/HecB family hemolysin secretion/activation protein [Buttiauxella warmboldiae]
MRLMILLLGLMLLPFHARALNPADRDTVIEQQQQRLEQNQQQRDELMRSLQPLPSVPSSSLSVVGPCFKLNGINLDKATLLTARTRAQLVAPYLHQCLDMPHINQLVSDVSEWYIGRGYITSRAFLSEQNLSSGQLIISVMEGRLQHIRMDEIPTRTLKMAFPGLEGEILNLRDIEQGMEQINRLRSNPVQIEILPGEKPGYSIVNLTATPEFPLRVSLGFDNSGQKSTGTGQLNGALTGNNLLGLADKWFVSGARSSDFSHSHDARSVQAGLSIPYGYSLFDYSYSWSQYLSTIDNKGFNWTSTGDSQTHRFTASHVLFRNGDIKTGASIGLTHQISNNYLNDAKLDSSSRKLSSLLFGLNHTQKILGGVATFNPTFSHGVPWLGAEDDNGKNDNMPKAEFKKWSVNGSFQLPVANDLWWLTSVYGQWSPDRLYGSERLTIGGESSVRGFKEQYLSGDNGGYLRNELNYTLFTLPFIGQVSSVAAIDGGWLQKDEHDPWASGTLWGAAVGLSSANRYYSSQFTVGTPLKYPDWLAPDHISIYYRVSIVL